jgi:hypothetical protein
VANAADFGVSLKVAGSRGWAAVRLAPLYALRALTFLAAVLWFLGALLSVLTGVPEAPLRAWPLLILFFACGMVVFVQLFRGLGELLEKRAGSIAHRKM